MHVFTLTGTLEFPAHLTCVTLDCVRHEEIIPHRNAKAGFNLGTLRCDSANHCDALSQFWSLWNEALTRQLLFWRRCWLLNWHNRFYDEVYSMKGLESVFWIRDLQCGLAVMNVEIMMPHCYWRTELSPRTKSDRQAGRKITDLPQILRELSSVIIAVIRVWYRETGDSEEMWTGILLVTFRLNKVWPAGSLFSVTPATPTPAFTGFFAHVRLRLPGARRPWGTGSVTVM